LTEPEPAWPEQASGPSTLIARRRPCKVGKNCEFDFRSRRRLLDHPVGEPADDEMASPGPRHHFMRDWEGDSRRKMARRPAFETVSMGCAGAASAIVVQPFDDLLMSFFY